MRIYRDGSPLADRMFERRYLLKFRWHYECQHRAMSHSKPIGHFAGGHLFIGHRSGHRLQAARYRNCLNQLYLHRRFTAP